MRLPAMVGERRPRFRSGRYYPGLSGDQAAVVASSPGSHRAMQGWSPLLPLMPPDALGDVPRTMTGMLVLRRSGDWANDGSDPVEHAMSLGDMPAFLAGEIADLAQDARFFEICMSTPPPLAACGSSIRQWSLSLTIGERSGWVTVAEPVGDWNLVALLAAVRRAIARLATPPI